MRCPSCQAELIQDSLSCPGCQFDLMVSESMLGADLIRLDRLTDKAHCLRLKEVQKLEAVLEEFERTFPQVFVAVYCGVLPASISMQELTFWLLNHAAFGTPDFKRLNEFGVVLVLDPVAKNVGLNVGYALESCMPESSLLKILKSMRTPLWHGEYATAVIQALKGISQQLRKNATKGHRSPEVLPPSTTEDFLNQSGLTRLRRASRRDNLSKRDEHREDLL